MSKVKIAVTAYLVVVGVLSIGAAHAQAPTPELAPQVKIDACLAEVDEKADYTDAGKIRHVIESKLSRRGTHRLSISTQVLDESDGSTIREYASVCFARQGDQPVLNRTRERF